MEILKRLLDSKKVLTIPQMSEMTWYPIKDIENYMDKHIEYDKVLRKWVISTSNDTLAMIASIYNGHIKKVTEEIVIMDSETDEEQKKLNSIIKSQMIKGLWPVVNNVSKIVEIFGGSEELNPANWGKKVSELTTEQKKVMIEQMQKALPTGN